MRPRPPCSTCTKKFRRQILFALIVVTMSRSPRGVGQVTSSRRAVHGDWEASVTPHACITSCSIACMAFCMCMPLDWFVLSDLSILAIVASPAPPSSWSDCPRIPPCRLPRGGHLPGGAAEICKSIAADANGGHRAELDADSYGLVTKLMSAVNKAGSPCKVRTHACMHAPGKSMPIRMHAPPLYLCPSLGLLADWQKSVTGLLQSYDACMQRSSRHGSRAQQHLSECSEGVPGGRSCGACTASQVPALASVHQRS